MEIKKVEIFYNATGETIQSVMEKNLIRYYHDKF